MPYYEEWYHNHSTVASGTRNYGAAFEAVNGFTNVDMLRLTSYRSRARKSPYLLESREVPREKADPFTIFQAVNGVKRDAALTRGFAADLFVEDRGHPYESVRYQSEGGLWSGKLALSSGNDTIRGTNLDLYPTDSNSYMTGFAPVVWTDLPSYAQSTYAKAAPLPEIFKLSQFLGELPMGLPRFGTAFAKADLLKRTQTLKAVGDDYLNLTFGWIPFLSDLISTGQALAGATTALLGPRGPVHRERREAESLTYTSGSGRSSLFATSYSTPRTNNTSDVQPFFDKMGRSLTGVTGDGLGLKGITFQSDILWSQRVIRNRWFEGSYSFIPKIGFNPDSYLERLEVLMDPTITPAVLWELAPWSWLVDWFVKIGDTIAANEVASDNRIISNYAYAMESYEVKRGAIFTNLSGSNYAGPSAIARQWTTTGKRRLRANPYGFKPMTTSGLNPNQWVILAALGLTRASR